MGWKEDNKGAGPWLFAPQANKWGYINNLRWSLQTAAQDLANAVGIPLNLTTTHRPCGHWHKQGVQYQEINEPFWQQSFGILKSEEFLGIGAMSSDTELMYILGGLNYNTESPFYLNLFNTTGEVYGYPGATRVGSNKTVYYANFVEGIDGYYDLMFYRSVNGTEYSVMIADLSDISYLNIPSYLPIVMAMVGQYLCLVFNRWDDGLGDFRVTSYVSSNNGDSWSAVDVMSGGDVEPYGTMEDVSGDMYSILDRYTGTKAFRLLKSSDYGNTWTEVLTTPVGSRITNPRIYISGSRIYAAGISIVVFPVYRINLYYSDDGGATWLGPYNPTNGIATSISEFYFVAYGDIVCGIMKDRVTSEYDIIRSADSGVNWTRIGTYKGASPSWGITAPISVFALAADEEIFCFSSCNATVTGTDYLAGLLSKDAGLTFEVINIGLSSSVNTPTLIQSPLPDEPQVWEI